jgi:hypothetical protein
METNWAEEHLQTIRTLMERSAIYRRALAPVMIVIGVLGLAGGIAGVLLHIGNDRAFVAYWISLSAVTLGAALLMIRRQALKDGEPFWSPPTRRIAEAVFLPFAAGAMLGLAGLTVPGSAPFSIAILIGWTVLYGCGLYSAGFFVQRGIRLFGSGFACAGFVLGFYEIWGHGIESTANLHSVMGGIFGVLHLAYGIYLFFTERRTNAT